MYRVLIIDDDRAVRYMLKRFKNWEGFGFYIAGEAADGKEGLKRLGEGADAGEEYDLIITDIKMPGMDGIEFMNEVRSLYPDLCVIFLSTHSDFSYAKQGIRMGVFDYMTKPVEQEALCEVLDRAAKHLDDKKQQRIKSEEDKRLLEENLEVFYPKRHEERLVEKLAHGDHTCVEDVREVFKELSAVLKGDYVKMERILGTLFTRISDAIYGPHSWLGTVEKIQSNDAHAASRTPEQMENDFVRRIQGLLDVVRKYELYQSDSIVKKTCEYVLSHVEEDISLEKISQEVHLRSDYVGKLFKKKTGYNFNSYVTKIKMEHAKYLIEAGDYKNYEISEKLGYSSPDYFCRLFKAYAGCTPIEFRRNSYGTPQGVFRTRGFSGFA
ncbi:AraC family two component transcriptional regulator [Anaerobacterium chartisolvens]|uniref:Stage 0 sporulation protein A homolog n=1 Tax=Anaerobacterium chartisolvens TaxID=1297424 RepID=A0A369AWR4_9FIRM|nr:response regulator [Anaerobacterium chartisolvens]RCX13535.1 AraC family two component transcriptional regulator [Anaerobacterium chartisolvens]